ncbi:MAG: hypothetical protein JXB39_15265 [Deltaproteobacteria bacterium]|nr:hypothetical protein [Deltaproteobacteria bacterium]
MFVLLLSSLALAADPGAKPDTPAVKVGGTIYTHFGYDLSEGADGYNAFALDRAYLTATAKLPEGFGARVTLDTDRVSSTSLPDGSTVTVDTKYRTYVKYAYVHWREAHTGIQARAGVVDTPYAPFYDSFMKIRYITKGFADRNKILDTADIGAGLQGTHAKGLLEWNAALLNGEGYGKPESDAGKAVQARITLDPLASGGEMNLPVTGFVSYSGEQDADPVITALGAVGFKQGHVAAWAEVLTILEGDTTTLGWSGTLHPVLPDVGGLLVRYDHLDPDTEQDRDASDTLIAGVTHDFVPKVSLAATYERTTREDDSNPSHGAFLRFQAGF